MAAKETVDSAFATSTGRLKNRVPSGHLPKMDAYQPTSGPPTVPSLTRLALVGAAVPAAFGLVHCWVLTRMQGEWRLDRLLTAAMVVAIVQVGVTGWLCGRLIGPLWLRWLIYGWTWFVIDVQTLVARLYTEQNYLGEGVTFLTGVIFSAQLSLVIFWAVLGTTRWTMRLAASGVLAAVLVLPLLELNYSGNPLAVMFLVHLLGITGLSLLLRRQGFLIARLTPSSATAENAPHRQLSVAQFGVRDILIWTTSAAFLLAMARFIEVSAQRLIELLPQGRSHVVITIGAASAIVGMVGLWTGLTEGSLRRRLPMLLLVTVAAGFTAGMLEWLSYLWEPAAWSRWGVRLSRSQFWHWFYQYERWLLLWFCLASGMLFTSLLFFRELGYRLARPRQRLADSAAERFGASALPAQHV